MLIGKVMLLRGFLSWFTRTAFEIFTSIAIRYSKGAGGTIECFERHEMKILLVFLNSDRNHNFMYFSAESNLTCW